ncbi:Universal stress protein UspA and related nucleotide-binding protein [alpha proteobacterium BAL199]|jgi:nucleotide-binding universal stress UspA family protein|nr:Universal stress protein UspA and related nucleotide-binding protein [alpha proteobacterium BAL199]
MSDSADSSASEEHPRVFLVVIDDSEEMRVALRFAGQRARHTGGRVALFRSIEPVEFQHWMGVGEIMREEARQEAEALMERMSEQVVEMTGAIPIIYLREGTTREELLSLIDEEKSISILVLGAAAKSDDPGPLISFLASKAAARLRIPITIVPGSLSDTEIDALT